MYKNRYMDNTTFQLQATSAGGCLGGHLTNISGHTVVCWQSHSANIQYCNIFNVIKIKTFFFDGQIESLGV